MDQEPTGRPMDAIMPGVVEPDDLGRVDLGGFEIPLGRLDAAQSIATDDLPMGTTVRQVVTQHLDPGRIPSSWLVLVEEPGLVVLGGLVEDQRPDWPQRYAELVQRVTGRACPLEPPWVVVKMAEKGSGWAPQSISFEVRPKPTRRAKGWGLILEWPSEPRALRRRGPPLQSQA